MIIQDALEKAKRQRQGIDRRAVPYTALPRPELRAVPAAELTLERYPYDPRVCEANRVLVPEENSEATLAGRAAYRMLRTRILHRMRANRHTTLAITSPGPGEGKSLTAINLALSIARERNNNVFLLDLDMCNPSICHYLGVAPRFGIARFLAGESEPAEALFSPGIDRLFISGGLDSTPFSSELLATGRVELLFDYIRSRATNPLILLDLPPALSTDDFLVVAPRVDSTLLVLAEGKTRRDGVQRTIEMLSGFPIAGVVLNRSHERTTEYYGPRN
jgi:Mrp family chromosome partitioning ATPase